MSIFQVDHSIWLEFRILLHMTDELNNYVYKILVKNSYITAKLDSYRFTIHVFFSSRITRSRYLDNVVEKTISWKSD